MASDLSNQTMEEETLTALPKEMCPIKDNYVETFFLFTAGIGSFCLLGFVTNILNLIIFSRKRSTTSNLLLKIVSIGDIMFLINCVSYFVSRFLYGYYLLGDEVFRRPEGVIMPVWYYISIVPYQMTLHHRNWLVVFTSLERLLSIRFPLWARVNITKSRVLKLVFLNIVVSIATHFSKFFDRVAVPSNYKCAPPGEVMYKKLPWGTLQSRYSYIIMTAISPLVLLYLMNILLVMSLWSASKNRKKLAGVKDSDKDYTRETQATVMVLGLVTVFAICETPASLDRIARLLGAKISISHPIYRFGRRVGLLLIVVDSSVNFFAYFISNPSFRQGIRGIFGGGNGKGLDDSMNTKTSQVGNDVSM